LEPSVFYTGIDQHRRSSVLTTYGEDGQVVGHATLPNEPGRLRRYFGQFPGSHRAVVEATGRWYWLRDLLVRDGIDLRLAHAKFLKAIAYAKVKTDAVDAGTLGQLLRTGLIPEAHMISDALRGPRDVLRTRLRLVQRCTSCRNSVDRLLEKFNVATVDQLPPLYQAQAAVHAAQIALLTDQIRQLERLVRPLVLDGPEIQRLWWIPGIGPLTAFTIYLEVDGISRFPTVQHFWSYCRLVPGAANSAQRMRHRSGNKEGNRYLKLAFSHATIRAIQYFPEIRAWYQRWKRKKPLRVARTLVAKELAKSVYVVLHEQVDFNHQFKGTPLTRHKQARWPRRASPST
jgi:transposase